MWETIRRLDWWQLCAVLFGIAQIFVIVCYFVWWTQPPQVVFVSDLLSVNMGYKAFMTVFVCVQLFFSLMYAIRHREHHWWKFVLMVLGLVAALVGWCMLSYIYLEPDQDSVAPAHIIGVMGFVNGSSLYFVLMADNVRLDLYRSYSRYKLCMALLIGLFFLTSIGMGAVFMVQFLNKHVVIHDANESSNSWVFEHIGYMSFVCAHVLFFVDETPNPFQQKKHENEENNLRKPSFLKGVLTEEDVGAAHPSYREPHLPVEVRTA